MLWRIQWAIGIPAGGGLVHHPLGSSLGRVALISDMRLEMITHTQRITTYGRILCLRLRPRTGPEDYFRFGIMVRDVIGWMDERGARFGCGWRGR